MAGTGPNGACSPARGGSIAGKEGRIFLDESIGLFPLDIGAVNIGLLQLNDRRLNLFNEKEEEL